MLTYLTLSEIASPSVLATHITGGVQVKGSQSGAVGFVYSTVTADTSTTGARIALTNVVPKFVGSGM